MPKQDGVIFSEGVLTYDGQPLPGIPELIDEARDKNVLVGIVSPRGHFPRTNIGRAVSESKFDVVKFEPISRISDSGVRAHALIGLYSAALTEIIERGANESNVLAVLSSSPEEELGAKHAEAIKIGRSANEGAVKMSIISIRVSGRPEAGFLKSLAAYL